MLLSRILKSFSIFLWAAVAFLIWNILIRPLLMEKVFSLILAFLALSFWLFLNGLEFLPLVILLLYIGYSSAFKNSFYFFSLLAGSFFGGLFSWYQYVALKFTLALTNVNKVFMLCDIVLTLRQTTFAKRQAIGTFLINTFFLRLFVYKQVAHCDSNNSQLNQVACESTVSLDNSSWANILFDCLSCFLEYRYSVFFLVIFLLIVTYLSFSFFFGRYKIMEQMLSFMFYLLFTAYGFYRCYYHLYATVDVFFCILLFKSAFIGYKNCKAAFEYAATSIDSKEDGEAARLVIQAELVIFNMKVFFSYLQLVLMQFYFLSMIIYVSLKENSNMGLELMINDFSLVKEINFFLLTMVLVLMAVILALAWSSNIYSGDTTYVGLLLLFLVIMPIFYYAALLLSFMHLSGLHAILFFLLFFYIQFLHYLLNVRSRFLKDNISPFLLALSGLMAFAQTSFWWCSMLIYALSRYLRLAYLNYAGLYNGDGVNIAAFCSSSQFNELINYIQLMFLCFLIGLIVNSLLAVRVYLAFLWVYVEKLSEVNIYLLSGQLVMIAYLISIVLNTFLYSDSDMLLMGAPFFFLNKKIVQRGGPLGVAAATAAPAIAVPAIAAPAIGTFFFTNHITNFIIKHTGTTLPREAVASSVDAGTVFFVGVIAFVAKRKGKNFMDLQERYAIEQRKFFNGLMCNDQHFVHSITSRGYQPDKPYGNDTFFKSPAFAEAAELRLKVKRQLYDTFAQTVKEGDARFGYVHRARAFFLGRHDYLNDNLGLKVTVPVTVNKEVLGKVVALNSHENRTGLKTLQGYTDKNGVPFFLHGDSPSPGQMLFKSVFGAPVAIQKPRFVGTVSNLDEPWVPPKANAPKDVTKAEAALKPAAEAPLDA